MTPSLVPFAVVVLLALSARPLQAPASRLDACVSKPAGRFSLPRDLAEISGLAWANDALLAHGDETASIYRIDGVRGSVTRVAFLEGRPRDDFEGIAVTDSQLVLGTSKGRLYLAGWPAAPGTLPYRVVETGLGRGCELEGLAWDAGSGALLMPCKRVAGEKRKHGLTVRRWHLARGAPLQPVVVRAEAMARAGLPGFRATSIEVDPRTGNWILFSGAEPGAVEMTPAGNILRAVRLSHGLHRQPEALALSPDGDLFVADEAAGFRATLTRYRCAIR
ncbi:MAG: hypothetical protein ACREMH_03170 [Gemmatimonadales bacterium]